MTLSVTLKNSNAPSSAPVAGRVVHTDNMQVLVRANNPINFFDLSNNYHALTKVNDATLIETNGIVANGDGGVNVVGLSEHLYNNFTLSGVFSTETDTASVSAVAQWLGGNYNGTGLGMGLFVRETVSGTSTLTIRAAFYYRTAAGTVGSQFVDLVIGTGLAARPAMPYHYVAMTQTSNTDGSATLTLYVPSFSATPVVATVVPGDDKRFYASSRQLNFAGSFPSMQIAAVPLSSVLDNTAHKARVKEFRFDSVALTTQQINDQYQQTKKWLQADGVVNVSGWL
jgi:hypothetical protein